jgi:hypothetical protein
MTSDASKTEINLAKSYFEEALRIQSKVKHFFVIYFLQFLDQAALYQMRHDYSLHF